MTCEWCGDPTSVYINIWHRQDGTLMNAPCCDACIETLETLIQVANLVE